MKYHFITSVLFAVSVSLMTLAQDIRTRMLLLFPVLILFYATFIVFSIEYDRERSANWKQKEKQVIENTYIKFLREHKKKLGF
ncbi:MAG: hypothetical protein HGA85_01650 [Nanoarchaeota archaeon]|nr:hypothetical protein [Nanoarchaeota archaeon]